jgi:hypothetical protein
MGFSVTDMASREVLKLVNTRVRAAYDDDFSLMALLYDE